MAVEENDEELGERRSGAAAMGTTEEDTTTKTVIVGHGWECTVAEVHNLELLRSRLSNDFTANAGEVQGMEDENDKKGNEVRKNKKKKVFTARFNDTDLVRHLRARDQDVDAAEALFRSMVAWREKHSMNTIIKEWEPPLVFQRGFPGFLLKG